jgi:type I restriction enzyme R subunit
MVKEFKAVRDPMLRYLAEIGWEYIEPIECNEMRGGTSGLFLNPILKQKLKELNKGIIEDEQQVIEVIKKLENQRANIQGNRELLDFLRGEKTIYVEKEKRELHIRLIDFENPENNVFHVTKELEFVDIKQGRADIVLFINGIPVIVIETKSPTIDDPIEEAFAQVRRYHEEIPEFMKIVQIFSLSDGIELRYGSVWNLRRKDLYRWKIKRISLEELTKTFFDKKTILDLISDYIVFYSQDDELFKFILKQHQIRAVEKIIERALEKGKDCGLIWHTQGSGKTLTMIIAANKLRKLTSLEKPTIIIVVDRRELEAQMKTNLKAFGFEPEVAESRIHLQKLLKTDYRGLIVTTIHKFEGIDEKINLRSNIFVFIDEAHRSQEGHLGNYMRGALPNAKYIGFTGTPIDRSAIGKGTFKNFGKYDPKGYLDKYSIKESIEDGTTVPLFYTLAPQELRLDKELLEKEFFDLVEREGIASIEQLNKLLDEAVRIKEFLKSPKRINTIAKFIAEHFKESVEPLGFKAFIVAVDREACALYKEALDKYLPKEYSEVVYTRNQKDDALLKKYHRDPDWERKIRRVFKSSDKLPKILIVTEKLLTGYDAPILYCIYLDKPMKDHTLLQAIARVNRPYDSFNKKKDAGIIVDFVGIFDNLKKALAFDSDTIEGAVADFDVLKKRFVELINKAQPYLKLMKGEIDDKTISKISERFSDPKERKKYSKLFKEIQSIYEILSPEIFLRKYLDDYKRLIKLYKLIQNIFRPKKEELYKDLLGKTRILVRKSVDLDGLVESLPVYRIDSKIVKVLEDDKSPDKTKIANLHRSITIHIQKNIKREPFLYSLGERAEEIIKRFEEKQIKTKEALEKLSEIAKQIATSEEEKAKIGLKDEEFNIYWTLKDNNVPGDLTRLAKSLFKTLDENKNWYMNKKVERNLRKKIYKQLLGIVKPNLLTRVVNSILEVHRRMIT